jgi:NAD-dependent SIR2 family protein deacetylase
MRSQLYIRPCDTPDGIEKLRSALDKAEAVVIGAGAGLSASAGFEYAGERFERYFRDFSEKFGFDDMYSGGFYPYASGEEKWAFWSRNIWINRYMKAPKPVYERLSELVRSRDHFVITTNVDHCFQKAGFDKKRLFYTQGDYGLWQCAKPCHDRTYDNEKTVRAMTEAQGFVIAEDGTPELPRGVSAKMTVPTELIPRCPVCGGPMTMNLRVDDTFVEDGGWHAASRRYSEYLDAHESAKTLFLDIGTGFNTPGVFKIPFWTMTEERPNAVYACLNRGQAFAPEEIAEKSVCINGDIGEILEKLG